MRQYASYSLFLPKPIIGVSRLYLKYKTSEGEFEGLEIVRANEWSPRTFIWGVQWLTFEHRHFWEFTRLNPYLVLEKHSFDGERMNCLGTDTNCSFLIYRERTVL